MRVIRVSSEDASETASLLRASVASQPEISMTVKRIVEDVRRGGDDVLIRLAEQLDGVSLRRDELVSDREEAREAFESLSAELATSLRNLRRRILSFERRLHRRLFLSLSLGGCRIDVVPVPLESVGCYSPGGVASYPSSVLMMGVPGQVAGVERLVLATPPKRREEDRRTILAAAYLAGFREIIWAGGAQAIAALAYGTGSIKRVSKIVGPGNRYVLEAKRIVSGDVAVDFTAGPTELLVVVDSSSPFRQVALEMAAQAEHSRDTLVGAIALDIESEAALQREITNLLNQLPEASNARISLENNGFLCSADSWEAARKFINALAPEHLLFYAKIRGRKLREIRGAGVVSYGPKASSVFLDYYAGPNHVLPTDGVASIRGGLSVLDFVKLLPMVRPSKSVLRRAYREIRRLVESEGLPLHLRALEEAARFDNR